jgi:dihydropyrimidinase
VGSWDVAVEGGKIVAVAEPGTLPGDVGRVVDAAGKIVVPGGIEPHTHAVFRLPYPGAAGQISGSPEEVSRAALFGGTTTVVDFANWRPGIDLFQAIEEKDAIYKGHCYADYTFHCILIGMGTEGATPEQGVHLPLSVVDQVKELIQGGFTTIKVWTTNTTPTRPKQMLGFGYVWAIMERVAAAGGVLAVHAEDEDIVMFMNRKLHEEERIGTEFLHEAHDNLSEDLSFRRVIRTAEWTGAAVYLMHVSAKEGVEAIAEARRKGQPVYGETLHHYATFTSQAYREPEGQLYHTYPSLKFQDDADALWGGLAQGPLSTVATDVVWCSREVKLRGKTIEDTVGGNAATEERMGITYTEGVVKRGMSLRRFADVTSSNAAKILGMYPRKGALAPGSDADIALIDPAVRRQLSLSHLHGTDYTVWEGWDVRGWPVTTILRGKVIVEDGKLLGTVKDGQLIGKRKTAPEILNGPAC